jgi:4-amino-4-deoxy-L-arabinose transferase-like glycosyltransferase
MKLPKFSLEVQWSLALLGASLFLGAIALGNVPLRDWDEGYYATVARDMYQTRNWLYPTYLADPFLLKPPLMMWLIALSYHLGGIGEFTTRLPGAVLSAGSVPLLYLVAREVFGEGGNGELPSPPTPLPRVEGRKVGTGNRENLTRVGFLDSRNSLPAVLTALVYLTLLPVVRHGRLAMLDGMVNTFFLLSVLSLLKARQKPQWAIAAGIGFGLIALTKGVLVILLAAIAAIFLRLSRQAKLFKNPYLWLGILLGSFPVVAWYLAQWQHYGETFLEVHFQAQSFDRLSTAVEGNKGAVWYYLVELLKYSLPWLLFFPSGLTLAWQQRRRDWGLLVLIGTILYGGTISLMGTKLPWYIMPLYPFFALAVGAYLAKFWQSKQRYPQVLFIAFSVLSLLFFVGGIYLSMTDLQFPLLLMAIILTVTMGVVAWKIKQNHPTFILILSGGLYLAWACLMFSKSWLWELNECFPVKPVAALIQAHTPANAVVYTSFAYSRPSLDFYSDRRVIAQGTDTLKQLSLAKNYLLLDRPTLENLHSKNILSLGTAGDFTLLVSNP